MSVTWYGGGMMERIRAAAMAGVVEALGIVEDHAVDLILNTPKTGKVYTTRFFTQGSGPNRVVIPYGTRPPHQASAPGEPPASDSGTLVNARRTELIPDRLAGRLIFSAKHAVYQQYGTDRIEPRPWADRALNEKRADIEAAILGSIRAAVR